MGSNLFTLAIAVVCLSAGCYLGRFIYMPKPDNHEDKQDVSGNVSCRMYSTTTNQVNLAAVTNALDAVDKLIQVRCFTLVKRHSFFNSEKKLLEECNFDKKVLKNNVSGLAGIINFTEVENKDTLEILKDQCAQGIKIIEGMSSNPHSYEEVFSKMDTDEVLLYYFLLAKYRTLMLAQMETAIVGKMTKQGQELRDLARKVDLLFAK
ncbi:MAG: hypothetical protein WCJ02_04045 [bacterium]